MKPSSYPGLPQRDERQEIMRLWSYSHDFVSWTVYREEQCCYVRRIVSKLDKSASAVLEPPTVGSEATMDLKILQRVLSELSRLYVPVIGLKPSGLILDGGPTMGIRNGNDSRYSEVELRNIDGSDQSEILQWFDRTTRTFDDLLPSPDPHFLCILEKSTSISCLLGA